MKNVQLIIPDLLPPPEWAGELFAGLKLPALEALLARGERAPAVAGTLEAALCRAFGVTAEKEGWPVAALAARAEGLADSAYWLRADPVHLLLQRDKVLALPVGELSVAEAAAFVADLNQHFSADGMRFFAPHPQRWYLQLASSPGLITAPLSQVLGRAIQGFMPQGGEALRWHRQVNEVQMLLHLHPLNEAREARGLRTVNGVWLWGGGTAGVALPPAFDAVGSDEVLAAQFAQLAEARFSPWTASWQPQPGSQLLVYGGLSEMLRTGDGLAWREWVQGFETGYAQPLLAALRRGRVSRLELRLPQSGGSGADCSLTPSAAWKLWRRSELGGTSLTLRL